MSHVATAGVREAARAITVPDDLTSAMTKLVYLFVQTVKETTAKEISQALNEPQLTILPLLRMLAKRGHVRQEGERVLAL